MGEVTVPHLHRLWWRVCGEKPRKSSVDPIDAAADKIAIYGLGLGLYETLQFLHGRQPGFDAFQDWILARNGGAVEPDRIAWVNDRIGRLAGDKSLRVVESVPVEPALDADDLAFWDENGYVVLREVVPREAARAAERAVWDFMGARPEDPDTWYGNADGHTIMVPLVHHPAFDANRRSPRIRAACAQLLGTDDLVVTVDRGGFNPPGAWLDGLPPGTNPRHGILKSPAVGIAGRAGDMVLWADSLPHGASPNRRSYPRIVQYIAMFRADHIDRRPWI